MSGSSLQRAFVPLPAGAQAVYNGSGLAYYRHPDWLGTSRLASTPSRTLYYDGAYAPYGESEQTTEVGTTDHVFTGQNQDTHSGLYDFMYREYHPVSGRWSSPDPAGLAAVDPSNPQSWNRYAYVMNDPMNYFDPFGLQRAADPDKQPGGGGYWYCVSSLNDNGDGLITRQVLFCVGRGGNGGGSGGNGGGGGGGTPNAANNFLKKLNTCVKNNAKNYSIGGVANLIFNAQIPGSGLASNSVTDTYLTATGQDGLLSSLWNGVKTGFTWSAASPIMTNGPNSLTTITPVSGSPQPVLGPGTNYNVSFWGKLFKAGAQLKVAADVGLSGALVLNCSLGQVQ